MLLRVLHTLTIIEAWLLLSTLLLHVKMYNENVSLSVRSKGHFLGSWAYAERVIFWVLERMLKGNWLAII